MLAQHVLDLGRIDVESAHDLHAFEAVRDLEAAVLIELANVAGVKPAILVDCGGRSFVILEISEHDVCAPQQNLAVMV